MQGSWSQDMAKSFFKGWSQCVHHNVIKPPGHSNPSEQIRFVCTFLGNLHISSAQQNTSERVVQTCPVISILFLSKLIFPFVARNLVVATYSTNYPSSWPLKSRLKARQSPQLPSYPPSVKGGFPGRGGCIWHGRLDPMLMTMSMQ